MCTPFVLVTPEQATRSIARKMKFIHQGLIFKGKYLFDPTVIKRVTWEPFGSGHRLVIVHQPSPAHGTCEATPHPNGTGASPNPFDDSSSTPNNTPGVSPQSVGDKSADPPAPNDSSSISNTPDIPESADPPAPAILSIVTKLILGQSWLYPDGQWSGPTKYVKRFADIKLLFTGGAPTHPRFANNYGVAIMNLNKIMGQVGKEHNKCNMIISGLANHICICHPLFTVCPTMISDFPLNANLKLLGIQRCGCHGSQW